MSSLPASGPAQAALAAMTELAQTLTPALGPLEDVSQVLGFARLEEGRVTVRESPFRLQTMLEDIVKVFSAEAAQRGRGNSQRALARRWGLTVRQIRNIAGGIDGGMHNEIQRDIFEEPPPT
mgnify:CR=1 FL=1